MYLRGGGKKRYLVKQRRLDNILKELKIKEVDFVTIDVEGYEIYVLKGIDFKNVNVHCFLIENNKDKDMTINMEIREFMEKQGYVFVGRLTADDIYIKIPGSI